MGQMGPGRSRSLTSDRILRATFWGFGGALGSWGHWRGQALEWEVGRGGALTWEAVVPAALHVESCQVQPDPSHLLKQPVSELIH